MQAQNKTCRQAVFQQESNQQAEKDLKSEAHTDQRVPLSRGLQSRAQDTLITNLRALIYGKVRYTGTTSGKLCGFQLPKVNTINTRS